MRRYFESLRPADVSAIHSVPDGLFLVRVDRAHYRWHKKKPYYEIRFVVLKPRHLTGCFMTGRLYCTPRAMWKLSWFLRDFGYDPELLDKNAIDEQARRGYAGCGFHSSPPKTAMKKCNSPGRFPCLLYSIKPPGLQPAEAGYYKPVCSDPLQRVRPQLVFLFRALSRSKRRIGRRASSPAKSYSRA